MGGVPVTARVLRRRETKIVASLLRAHLAMSAYDMKEAALALFTSRGCLRSWQSDVATAKVCARPLLRPAFPDPPTHPYLFKRADGGAEWTGR